MQTLSWLRKNLLEGLTPLPRPYRLPSKSKLSSCKKKFAKAALNEHVKAFVMYVTSLLRMAIYPDQKAQIVLLVIEKVQIPTLVEHVKTFVMHVTFLSTMAIHLDQEAQIVLLVIEEVQISALNENIEVFVVHMTSLSLNLMPIHPA